MFTILHNVTQNVWQTFIFLFIFCLESIHCGHCTDHRETLWLKLRVDQNEADAKTATSVDDVSSRTREKFANVGQAIGDLTENNVPQTVFKNQSINTLSSFQRKLQEYMPRGVYGEICKIIDSVSWMLCVVNPAQILIFNVLNETLVSYIWFF